MNRDLSLRGILSEWVREVFGIEGRLPRTLGKLFAHPGFLTRAALEGERDSYLSALKLFLVANLAVFLVGPYVGLFAFELNAFVDDVSTYRALVERELLGLGMSAEAYELRFNFTIAQYAPTFIFLVIPALAGVYKALLPNRLFGEHLVQATDFVAWVILVMLPGVIVGRLIGIPLESFLDDQTLSPVIENLVVAGVVGLVVWYVSRSLRAVFGLRGAGLWTRTVLIAAGLVGLLAGYSLFLFWATIIAVRLS